MLSGYIPSCTFHDFFKFYPFCSLSRFLNYVSRVVDSLCKERFCVEVLAWTQKHDVVSSITKFHMFNPSLILVDRLNTIKLVHTITLGGRNFWVGV